LLREPCRRRRDGDCFYPVVHIPILSRRKKSPESSPGLAVCAGHSISSHMSDARATNCRGFRWVKPHPLTANDDA
jgi:hypothetical protein